MGFRKNTYEDKRLICLSFLLFVQILLDFVKVYLRGDSSIFTYAVYIGSLIIIFLVFRRDISIRSLGLLSLFYALFGISYLLFPDTHSYYSTDAFVLLCVYYLPIVFLVVARIRNWESFFEIMSRFGIAAVIMGVYIVFFSGVDNYSADERYFTYMEFSYALLPFVCSLYKNARDKKSWLLLVFFLLGLFEMLAFGSRATVLYTLLFVLMIEMFANLSNVKSILLLGAVTLVFIFSFNSIVNWLAGIPALNNSYIVQYLVNGDLFLSESREIIYQNCNNRINTMGLDVSGFFGDRQYCGSVYPHNIVIEILMQWGWIFGISIMAYLLIMVLKAWGRKSNHAVLVFIVCCLLGRYFVSGTYVTEGRFWIFYGCLLALTSRSSNAEYERTN